MNRLSYLIKRHDALEKSKDKVEKIYEKSYSKLLDLENKIFTVEEEMIQLQNRR